MRGKDIKTSVSFGYHRITPAYAGKSSLTKCSFWKTKDHPRLCGEKFLLLTKVQYLSGSPPPMRGKVQRPHPLVLRPGITPAYAGKSGFLHSFRRQLWDHPRLCGEKLIPANRKRFPKGSPPPMRGKDYSPHVRSLEPGITPAYAGKSCFAQCFQFVHEDHPRLCGEKTAASAVVVYTGGSPPPMRGKAPILSTPCTALGITPAYAGKS